MSLELPDRTLGRQELRDLVDRTAADPALWQDLVEFPAGGDRHYAPLHRDGNVDVWLLCWVPGNDTGWHDHDISSGAVHVVAGAVRESNPRLGGAHLETVLAEGDSICFGPEHIHRMMPATDRAISIHAYSPPLVRLGQYTFDNGVMRRTTIGPEAELRPQDAA